MAMKPQLPKKPKSQVGTRDLKARKDPKGGAQKKEIEASARSLSRTGSNQLQ